MKTGSGHLLDHGS